MLDDVHCLEKLEAKLIFRSVKVGEDTLQTRLLQLTENIPASPSFLIEDEAKDSTNNTVRQDAGRLSGL